MIGSLEWNCKKKIKMILHGSTTGITHVVVYYRKYNKL